MTDADARPIWLLTLDAKVVPMGKGPMPKDVVKFCRESGGEWLPIGELNIGARGRKREAIVP